jgi:shikimate dehydrogenase
MLGRQLIDLDMEISKREGMSIEDIFAKRGENYFREIESEVAREAAGRMGVVIATGGGTIMREENFLELHRNGLICYVMRDLKKLSSFGRPVTKKRGAEEIFRERKSTYEKADFSVFNDENSEQAAKEIVEFYEKNTRY